MPEGCLAFKQAIIGREGRGEGVAVDQRGEGLQLIIPARCMNPLLFHSDVIDIVISAGIGSGFDGYWHPFC